MVLSFQLNREADGGASITCRRCGMTSHFPYDVANLYCGNCHAFHAAPRIDFLQLAQIALGHAHDTIAAQNRYIRFLQTERSRQLRAAAMFAFLNLLWAILYFTK
jgi:hypothetical protein